MSTKTFENGSKIDFNLGRHLGTDVHRFSSILEAKINQVGKLWGLLAALWGPLGLPGREEARSQGQELLE